MHLRVEGSAWSHLPLSHLSQSQKTANAPGKAQLTEDESSTDTGKEVDVYDTNLTQEEIQKVLNVVNANAAAERKRIARVFRGVEAEQLGCSSFFDTTFHFLPSALNTVETAIAELAAAVQERNQDRVLAALKAEALDLQGVEDSAAPHYVQVLAAVQQSLPEGTTFTRAQIQDAVDKANAEAEQEHQSEILGGWRNWS